MATPLTDGINALTAYANEITGASDTTLSDAVHTLASGYGGGGTRTTIVPEQTITGTSQWTLIPNSGTLIEGEYYAVTVNGEEKISTGTVYDGIVYISFIDWDWGNGGYAFGSDVGGNGVYFRANESGSYTIKVDRLTISNEATLITKTIAASDDSADGYSEVTEE